jgi:hypothetical protein
MKAGEYECAHCGGVFERARPDKEALEEYTEKWPEGAAAGEAICLICDPCYQAVMHWFDGLPEEEKKSMREAQVQKHSPIAE